MSFALDTNACVEVLRSRDSKVLLRYRYTDPRHIVLPSMVAAELFVGAEKSVRPTAKAEVESFILSHEVLPFGEDKMRVYANIRARLELTGQKIGPNDLIIATTVLVAGATLVTNNTKEFSRVPGLKLVDWQI